jgi:putative transposase
VAKDYVAKGKSVRKVLYFSHINNSTWYKQKSASDLGNKVNVKGRPVPGYTINPDGTIIPDIVIVNALKDYRNQIDFSNAGGYQKLNHYLRKDFNFFVNPKKIYRLCRENKLLLPKHKKKRRKGGKVCINRIINGPNQLWEFDIKYGYIHGLNRHFFILIFIDVFTRKVMDYYVGMSCRAGDLKFTLQNALKKAKLLPDNRLTIRSDNGTQMTSYIFQEYLKKVEMDLQHEFIPPSTPNKNAHVESFNSILEIEFLQVRYFRDFADAYKQTFEFIERYNNYRVHKSLGYRCPDDAIKALQNGEKFIKDVRV